MLRGQRKNPLRGAIRRAVELSRVPGSGSRESAAGRGGVNTQEDAATVADENGYTVHVAITELDYTDNPAALTTV